MISIAMVMTALSADATYDKTHINTHARTSTAHKVTGHGADSVSARLAQETFRSISLLAHQSDYSSGFDARVCL